MAAAAGGRAGGLPLSDDRLAAWGRQLAALPLQLGAGDGGFEDAGGSPLLPALRPPPPAPRRRGDPGILEPYNFDSQRQAGIGGGYGGGRATAVVAAAGRGAFVMWQHALSVWGSRRGLLSLRGQAGMTDPEAAASESEAADSRREPKGGVTRGRQKEAAATGSGGATDSAAPAALPLCLGCGEGRHAYHIGSDSLGRGHFGEVWRAVRRQQDGSSAGSSAGGEGQESGEGEETVFVLKRVLGSRGAGVRLSGVREAYFGTLLKERERVLRLELAAAAAAAGGGGEKEEEVDGPEQRQGKQRRLVELVEGHEHIVQFEEGFEVSGDVWLVFKVG